MNSRMMNMNIEVVEMELGEGFLVERRDSSHFAFLAMFSSYLKVNIEPMHCDYRKGCAVHHII